MWTLSSFSDEAGKSAQEQIEATRRAGLSRLDIRSINGYNIVELPVEDARTLKQQLDDAGMAVQMFGSPIGKIDIADELESDLQKLRHLGTLAPILECNAVRFFSYYNKQEKSHDEWKNESLSRLQKLRDEAEKLGLVLYHENERHIFGDRGRDVKEIAALRNTNFKLIFDFDNYQQGGEDVFAVWESLREQTDAFHLKDSTSDNRHIPVGQGNGQVREILADAVQRGWNGPLAVEPHLTHSKAVAATGPSGQQNEAYASMPAFESFHIAVEVAKQLLGEVGAQWK